MSMKSTILLAFITLAAHSSNAQHLFKSPRYKYSFTIPPGWRVKDEIVMPDTDAKIVDDRGNSLIITINPLPSEFKNTSVIKLISMSSDQDLLDMWASAYGKSYILRRGTTILSGREFYFVHMSCPFKDDLRIIHKMYMYNWKGNSLSIDCASISSMEDEASVYFDVMIRTLKLE